MKANVLLGDSEKFLVKAEVAASMKQQLYKMYVHSAQQNESVSMLTATANLEKVDAVSMLLGHCILYGTIQI